LFPAVHIKLGAVVHTKLHHFTFLPSILYFSFTACCTAPTPHAMASKTDHHLPVTDGNKSDSRTESDIPVASSLSNMATAKIADKIVPHMFDYWKKSMITEAYRKAYHSTDWLSGGLESLVPEVNIPTVDGSTVVCFKLHLIARIGLPPSKFLVVVMNFLGCELVHLNLNAIAALSCFTMLCECWLGIALDTSLFWYFYSPARYGKVIYSRIRLSLHRSCRKQYNDTTFKSSWRSSS
jgi:hypothetical protein